MLKRNPVSHHKQSIWKSSIAKVDLRSFLVLILAAANHKELIEFILLPCAFKVPLIWVDLKLLLILVVLFPFLLLPQAIGIRWI